MEQVVNLLKTLEKQDMTSMKTAHSWLKYRWQGKKNKMTAQAGFSILELVVSIFILAVVIGTGMLLIAANLNLMTKSNDIMIATALAQYESENIRNIDFPPVYSDRTADDTPIGDYPPRISDSQPPSYNAGSPNANYKILVGCVWFGGQGQEITDSTNTDSVVLRKVKIEIRRARDNALIYYLPLFITRNGMY
jgi:type II secretory pathway pseudopilin PulG